MNPAQVISDYLDGRSRCGEQIVAALERHGFQVVGADVIPNLYGRIEELKDEIDRLRGTT